MVKYDEKIQGVAEKWNGPVEQNSLFASPSKHPANILKTHRAVKKSARCEKAM